MQRACKSSLESPPKPSSRSFRIVRTCITRDGNRVLSTLTCAQFPPLQIDSATPKAVRPHLCFCRPRGSDSQSSVSAIPSLILLSAWVTAPISELRCILPPRFYSAPSNFSFCRSFLGFCRVFLPAAYIYPPSQFRILPLTLIFCRSQPCFSARPPSIRLRHFSV